MTSRSSRMPAASGPAGLLRQRLLLVAAEDGKGEQVPEGVGVDVARRSDEMGDVAPPDPVAVGDVDGVAQHGLLDVYPQGVEAVGGELALGTPGVVDAVLEAVHR